MGQNNPQVEQLQQTFRKMIGEGNFVGLFNEMYAQNRQGVLPLPWVTLSPNTYLVEWADQNFSGEGKSALVIGSGLGDDAHYLATRGFRVTGFDFSPVAVQWAKERFPDSSVDFQVADLLALPTEWGTFDFVLEIFTLQSLPRPQLPLAIANAARTVAIGGQMLVICFGSDDPKVGPIPLPLTRGDLDQFQHSLEQVSFEDFSSPKWGRLFRAVYRR